MLSVKEFLHFRDKLSSGQSWGLRVAVSGTGFIPSSLLCLGNYSESLGHSPGTCFLTVFNHSLVHFPHAQGRPTLGFPALEAYDGHVTCSVILQHCGTTDRPQAKDS